MSEVLDDMAAKSGGKIKTASTRARALSMVRSSSMCCATRSAATGSAAPRRWTSTLPERFGAFYIDKDSEKKQPVMVHRAICGSLERFLGILIESYAGHMPLWFAPLQVVVATITSEADEYAREGRQSCARPGFRSRRTSQREDQLQGARAFAGQGAGDPGLRQARGGGELVNVRRLGSRDQSSMTACLLAHA
jgi:threonyl-tRNA synthetase